MTFHERNTQVVDPAGDAGFGENSGGLLERRGGDEAVRRERGLGDAEQEWRSVGGPLITLAFYQAWTRTFS